MSKFDDYSIDLVIFMLRKMADKMEEDPAFAQQLLEESKANRQTVLKKTKKTEKKPADNIAENKIEPVAKVQKKPSKVTKNPSPEIVKDTLDIYACYIEGNEQGLRNFLEQLERETLVTILSKNHLDPSYKVRRWKATQRIIDFIVTTVANRLSQGDAFKTE